MGQSHASRTQSMEDQACEKRDNGLEVESYAVNLLLRQSLAALERLMKGDALRTG